MLLGAFLCFEGSIDLDLYGLIIDRECVVGGGGGRLVGVGDGGQWLGSQWWWAGSLGTWGEFPRVSDYFTIYWQYYSTKIQNDGRRLPITCLNLRRRSAR